MAKEKKLIFKFPDVPKRSFKYFEALKNEKKLCDITLQIGRESVAAHRIIITAVIPYFQDILQKDEKDISVPNIEPNALKCLVEFAYTCEVKIDEENVRSLLTAACYLGVDVVRDACCDFLGDNLEHDNVLNVRQLADSLNCAQLLKHADFYIKRNFAEVVLTKDFLECPATYLNDLIGKDDIKVDDEKKVFEAVLRWVKSASNERKEELPKLMRKVRMPLLNPLYLAKIVERESIIWASLLCRDLIDEAKHYVLFPELRKSSCSFVTVPRKCTGIVDTDNKTPHICKLSGEIKFTAQNFDLVNKKWGMEKTSTFYLNGGSSVEMHKKMYFFYKGKAKEYDPAANTYRNLNPMPTQRIYATATALKNQIYVCGGKIGSFPCNAVERFDPAKNEWTRVSFMNISCWGSSSVNFDGYIFVLGGTELTSVHSTIQRYDPVADKWEIMSSLLKRRFGAGAAILNGKIYICGGYVPKRRTLFVSATAEMYDPIRNRSTFISPMITARTDLTLLTCLGNLYALGGKNNHGKPVRVIDVYNPETDEWTCQETDVEFPIAAAVVL